MKCEEVSCSVEACSEIHIKHKGIFPIKCKGIDPKEVPFLFDQRGKREMYIGGVHVQGSLALREQEKRHQARREREQQEKLRVEREKTRVENEKKEQAEANSHF